MNENFKYDNWVNEEEAADFFYYSFFT